MADLLTLAIIIGLAGWMSTLNYWSKASINRDELASERGSMLMWRERAYRAETELDAIRAARSDATRRGNKTKARRQAEAVAETAAKLKGGR